MKLRTHYLRKTNLKFLTLAMALLVVSALTPYRAVSYTYSPGDEEYLVCTDFKFVFARGSGTEVGSERDFIPFKQAVDEVFGQSPYTYSFYELGSRPGGWHGYTYPAPGIGISTYERFNTSIGALASGGEYHEYGESVENGSLEALFYTSAIQSWCPNTKVIYAGYSQGAQVISRTLQQTGPMDIFAALTFGDPKLYLPEGRLNILSMSTAACRGENLSDYRAYVPDCYAYQGILGGYKPYKASDKHAGVLKAYCQFHDVICSSSVDLDKIVYGHASYAEQGTYKRAIEDVYNMIQPATYNRPSQDVAILFDITGSMGPLIDQFKSEAISVARRVLNKGGKVALYTYGDLEETDSTQLCDFEHCNADNVEAYIRNITVEGGGDKPESLLSASYKLMRELKWEIGANKSLVVLTDADYHNPDRDGITLGDVVSLSKSIDPVNFYILTNEDNAGSYVDLATLTEGGVYTADVASALEDIESEFLSRDPGEIYISTDLPSPIISTVSNLNLSHSSATAIQLSYTTDAVISIITIDEMPIGYTDEKSIEITDLDLSEEFTICVSPISSTGYRGDPSCITNTRIDNETDNNKLLISDSEGTISTSTHIDKSFQPISIPLPKAPNTGKHYE